MQKDSGTRFTEWKDAARYLSSVFRLGARYNVMVRDGEYNVTEYKCGFPTIDISHGGTELEFFPNADKKSSALNRCGGVIEDARIGIDGKTVKIESGSVPMDGEITEVRPEDILMVTKVPGFFSAVFGSGKEKIVYVPLER
ncbi:MAG: hypothetical protein V1648_00600 [Candidatus Aenigmatarchaeota archaeon]